MRDEAADRSAARLLSSQKSYYDLRAPDYMDVSKPSDRNGRALMEPAVVRALVDELQLRGNLLEFACGDGVFTRELARHARSLTAIDASPQMLARNRRQVAVPDVAYVECDIFNWVPDREYDAVFFGFWLSHVPPSRLDAFWELVRGCLRPGGRVAFVDEDDRSSGNDERRVVDGVPVARRTLRDGRQFDIVKIFWDPSDLEQRLRDLSWDVDIHTVGDYFMCGVARHRVSDS